MELSSALYEEATEGVKRIFPLLVGSKEIHKEILERVPLLRDKRFLRWEVGPIRIVNELYRLLEKQFGGS